MRDAFVAELYDQRAVDPNIICLAGDIGYRCLINLDQISPVRF